MLGAQKEFRTSAQHSLMACALSGASAACFVLERKALVAVTLGGCEPTDVVGGSRAVVVTSAVRRRQCLRLCEVMDRHAATSAAIA